MKKHFQKLFYIFLFILNNLLCYGQLHGKNEFQGLHTKEIYDMLVDKKGFLWVASNIGVSRYNGSEFTDFSDPSQTSISATGLFEDSKGRIWFNNFSGQIFYIENEEMHLLKEYDASKEITFPRIALFHDNVVATSSRGLFVFNTHNMTGKYVSSNNSVNTHTTSLSVLRSSIVAYGGNGQWFIYKNNSLKNVKLYGKPQNFIDNNISTLNATTKNDTALLISNPSGNISRIVIRNDSLLLVNHQNYSSFINTVTVDNKSCWVNTKLASYSLNGAKPIPNYNLTDIVTDNNGNTWFGSINMGLNVIYAKESLLHPLGIPLLQKNDLVVSLKKIGNNLLLGTQNGRLLDYDYKTNATLREIVFPQNSGSVNNITAFNNTTFIVGCSANTYLADIKTGKYKEIPNVRALKQIDRFADALYIASSQGLFVLPGPDSLNFTDEVLPYYKSVLTYNEQKNYLKLGSRCRAVCYDSLSKTLYAAFNGGVYVIKNKGISTLRFKGEPVYATSLNYAKGRIFIGTVNKGLLILSGSGLTQIDISKGLLSKRIFSMKLRGNNLWILGDNQLQKYNIITNNIENIDSFSSQESAQVMDVEQIGNSIFLATFEGLYLLMNNSVVPVLHSLPNYLLSISINNKQQPVNTGHDLDFQHNNIQFKIGIPVYKSSKDVTIKYCLITDKDTVWRFTQPGERTISFFSLMPGKYRFIAFAVDPSHNRSNNQILYDFIIRAPWWQQVWFKILIAFIVLTFIFFILKNFFSNKRQYQQMLAAQQELIRFERRRISSEIHDDIGSGIFAIQLFADMANKARTDVSEIAEISKMVKDMSKKINEIIWSTNIENDNLENLLYYVQFQTTSLFEHSEITFDAHITEEIPDISISSQNRKDIYLVIKELVHNAIKHSRATNITLEIEIVNQFLTVQIIDNGIGFDPGKLKAISMGLANVKIRLENLQGEININSTNGTVIKINIPLIYLNNSKIKNI